MASSERSFDRVVIGAGAFGAWTALSLVQRGARVLLVDAHGPGNHVGSSGGESRNIRCAYGDREIYTRWSIAAWARWQVFEAEEGRRLVHPSGSLRVLPDGDIAGQCAVFDRLGHPHEMLTAQEVQRRWPQIGDYGDAKLLYEPLSGTIAAHGSLVAVIDRFTAQGGVYRQGRVAMPQTKHARLDALLVGEGSILADGFIFACGPWLPMLFPDLLGRHIKTPRRELFFLGPPAGDDRFGWRHCPSLADPLGWTSSDIGGGVKIAPIIRHVPMNPDDGSRMPTPALLDQVRGYVAKRLPGLAARPVVATYVSQLENSDNDHFIIDRHPGLDDVVIAGGGSGHAFKMGPVIGDHVAGLSLDGAQDAELAAIFGIAAHRPVAADQGG